MIKKVYLAGAMESVEDAGLGWRLRYSEVLKDLFNIECIIPNYKEIEFIPEDTDWNTLKQTNLYEYIRLMKVIMEADLNLVKNSDAVICRWDGERIAGTVGEAQFAYQNDIPFYLVCKKPFYEAPGWLLACSTEIYPELSCFLLDLADILYKKSKV